MNITLGLGWLVAAAVCIAAAFAAVSVQGWFTGQYEVTRHGFRFTVTRRWYGIRAWVILRSHRDDDEPERFRVLRVDGEDLEAPWLKVGSVDFAEDEAAEPFWAAVTDFYPEAVRRLRPWVFRYGRLRVPILFAYRAPRRPAGYLGDTGAAVPAITGAPGREEREAFAYDNGLLVEASEETVT